MYHAGCMGGIIHRQKDRPSTSVEKPSGRAILSRLLLDKAATPEPRSPQAEVEVDRVRRRFPTRKRYYTMRFSLWFLLVNRDRRTVFARTSAWRNESLLFS